jgi:cytochrome c oxidase assembly factor CtaG/putative copper export protein
MRRESRGRPAPESEQVVGTARAVRAAAITGVAALAAFVLAALAGGTVAETVIPGLWDAGTLTRWGLPLTRLVMDMCATVTVGALLMATVLLPAGKDGLRPYAISYVRAASWSAASWSVAAAANLVLTVSDVLGEPVGQVLSGNELRNYVGRLPQGTALLLVVLMSVMVAVLSRTTTTPGAAMGLLALAFFALLPPSLTGHSASSANPEVAVTGVALHIAAVVPWVGGLAMLAWHALAGGGARAAPDAGTTTLEIAAGRFSRMALWCYVAVGVSGLAIAVVSLPHPSGLYTTDYGRLMLVKTAAFVSLGYLGWIHRRHTLPAVAARKPRAFARLAAVESAMMAGTIGVAVALTRTAPPAVSGTESIAKSLLGYDLPPPLTVMRLVTLWRFDLFFAVLVVALGAAYLAGVMRLRRRGHHWQIGRTVCWFFGLVTIVIATMSGVATYSPILFSVHMAQHMVLAMLTPIFLVLAAPITLTVRALRPAAIKADRGPREWVLVILHSRSMKLITHPAVATIIFVASTYALYFTPLFEAAMLAHLGHIVMLISFLLSGGLFYWVLIGTDPAPHKLHYSDRILVLSVTVPFHAFLGISLMNSYGLASNWYNPLGRTWGPSPASDVHTGGSIAWAFGEIPTLIVLIAIVFQWLLQDRRPARLAASRPGSVSHEDEFNKENGGEKNGCGAPHPPRPELPYYGPHLCQEKHK